MDTKSCAYFVMANAHTDFLSKDSSGKSFTVDISIKASSVAWSAFPACTKSRMKLSCLFTNVSLKSDFFGGRTLKISYKRLRKNYGEYFYYYYCQLHYLQKYTIYYLHYLSPSPTFSHRIEKKKEKERLLTMN